MATTTTNLGLTKPIGTEQALVSVINGNMDIIDSKVGAVPANKNVQGQIDSLSDHIAKLTPSLVTGNTLITLPEGIDCTQPVAYKVDRICFLFLRFRNNNGFGSRTYMGTLARPYAPIYITRFAGAASQSYDSYLTEHINGYIFQDGGIYVDLDGENQVNEINICIAYPTIE